MVCDNTFHSHINESGKERLVRNSIALGEAHRLVCKCADNNFTKVHPVRLGLFDNYAMFVFVKLQDVEEARRILLEALPSPSDPIPPESEEVVAVMKARLYGVRYYGVRYFQMPCNRVFVDL
jgi:hypothetical protein